MRPAPHQGRRAAFSITELMLAISLLTVLLSSVAMVGRTSVQAFRHGSASSALEQRASAALTALVRELDRASLGSITPDPSPGLGASELQYAHTVDVIGGDVMFGPPRVLRLELSPGEADNGVDDDGDGLVDERRVIVVENLGLPIERSRVLAHDVAELLDGESANGLDDNGNGLVDEAGFVLERRGATLELQATFTRATSDGVEVLARSVRSSVMLRN